MLELKDITIRYGGLTALQDVTFAVPAGAFVALIGANGAGKSTLFKAICGTVDLAAGQIRYRDADLFGVDTYRRAQLGIAHVPEGRRVFKTMTVEENVDVGTFSLPAGGSDRNTLDMIYGLFPRLAERRKQLAGTLSGGEQQMLAIARALASRPALLLLDEPSMGLAPTIVDEIFETVRRMHRERGLTILLVEQRVVEALELCDTGYVLQNGKIVLSGDPAKLMSDGRMSDAYVGH